ncbi:MAG: biosynthetic-type acetolactate synthase large subunit, partial [Pseudomonadota bacterium]
MKLTGAQILLEVLKEEGVDTIFGYPGGAVIDIFDELYKSDIRFFLVRHEQAAVHAADGYARASQKVGVCLVTSGPGATNTVSGIASAYMDSIPVVIFTGQVPTSLIGNDAFQEVDIVGITRPCTKHNYLVKDVDKLGQIVREAFYLARSGRPGPVLIDLPKDIVQAKTTFEMPSAPDMKSYRPTIEPHKQQLERAIKLMLNARKPVVFAGGGVVLAQAHEELFCLAERLKIPVTGSLMGLGAFPGTHPLWLGMLGMHGTYRANMSVGECDLLIGIGVRFDDRVTGRLDAFARNAKIIHIDIDPTSIQKNIPVTIPIVGDCKISLKRLNKLLEKEDISEAISHRDIWLNQLEEWKTAQP